MQLSLSSKDGGNSIGVGTGLLPVYSQDGGALIFKILRRPFPASRIRRVSDVSFVVCNWPNKMKK